MPTHEVFVEERNGSYVALMDKRVICTGDTQAECGEKAHKTRPQATIFAERVRETTGGSPDQWRVLHHPSA